MAVGTFQSDFRPTLLRIVDKTVVSVMGADGYDDIQVGKLYSTSGVTI